MILAHLYQLQWLPCLTRDEESGKTHCWFLAPTNLGSLFCKHCRRARAARVQVEQPIAIGGRPSLVSYGARLVHKSRIEGAPDAR